MCTNYAAKWRFSFNQKKSQVVVVGRPTAKKKAEQFRWMLSGKVLELVGEYKYLSRDGEKCRFREVEYTPAAVVPTGQVCAVIISVSCWGF